MVTGEPPADIVVPATEKAVVFGVIVWPAMTKAGLDDNPGFEVGTVKVVLPITRAPERPRLRAVPSIVTAGPPAEIDVPAIEKAVGPGVIV